VIAKKRSDLLTAERKALSIILFILAADFCIVFDLPIFRQIMGFLLLMLIPGILIQGILKFKDMAWLEKIVYSWGLSLSFLLFFGLLINSLSLYFGYLRPLEKNFFLPIFNLSLFILLVLDYMRNRDFEFFLPDIDLSVSETNQLMIPLFFPLLSFIGIGLMNSEGINILIITLFLLIVLYISVCIFYEAYPKQFYPYVIFMIGVSLLMLTSLRSDHLIGADVHLEYYFFHTTLDRMYWSIDGYSTLNACLSISLLPTIFYSTINLPPELLFKTLYSFLFSLSPIAIYVLSRKYLNETSAFVASCFFMFQIFFLRLEINPRTSVAVFFFMMSMVVIFSETINPLKKRFLLIVFLASCLISHYSTTYIFFFIMLSVFILETLISLRYRFNKDVGLTTLILFLVFIFFWYSQVTQATFDSGVKFVKTSVESLNRLFIMDSRGESTQALFGKGFMEKGIPQKIEFIYTWLMFFFIGLGVVSVLKRFYVLVSSGSLNTSKYFSENGIEIQYIVTSLICSLMLISMVMVPRISSGYSLDRLYVLASTVLSTFFVIGGITLVNALFSILDFENLGRTNKQKTKIFTLFDKSRVNPLSYLVLLLVLVPYFFSINGLIYDTFGHPRSILLNSEGDQYNEEYIHEEDSTTVRWLKEYQDKNFSIYADHKGVYITLSQGLIDTAYSKEFTRKTFPILRELPVDYVFLNYLNAVDGKMLDVSYTTYNLSEGLSTLEGMNKIYDNRAFLVAKGNRSLDST
jgi:uncharacterized membrane protein